MPDLHVTRITKTAPACESGRHLVHPFYECDEVDLMAKAFAGLYRDTLAQPYAEAVRTPIREVPAALRGPNWKARP